MGFLDADKVAATQIGFSTIFQQEFLRLNSQPATDWEQLATVVDSDQPIEQYNWLGTNPAFQKWRGDRKIGKVRNYNYTIRTEDWANGLQVDRNDLEDDKLGMYRPQIMALAKQAIVHRLSLMVDFLVNGFATTVYGAAYDGKAFFANDHVDGDGPTNDNLLTATLDDSGAFDAAYQLMQTFKDENSEPLYLTPTHLLCGPSNRANARALLVAEHQAAGASNTNYQQVVPIISPKITDGKWFLLCLSEPIKPLIFQRRREVTFDSVTEGTDAFMKRVMLFGASARYNVGYGLWQMAVGSDAST